MPPSGKKPARTATLTQLMEAAIPLGTIVPGMFAVN